VARPPAHPVFRGPVPAVPGEPQVSEFVGAIHGSLREFEFYSPALDREMPYFIYLPPHYGTEQRRYPVLYMLHGIGGHREEWAYYGLVDTLDLLISSKEIRPLILVLPQGDFGYWVNHVGDGPQWGDYIAENLVRHVDATFRTLPHPEHRAIGGLSNGARAALQLGFTHPDVFHVIGAHSPSLHEEGSLPIAGTGEEFAQRDPISLVSSAPGIEAMDIWIDVGEDDPWLRRADLLHRRLNARGINHWWSILPGGHEGEYWQQNLVTYLRFYDSVLHWRNEG
jgi:enterochelin esterase-like enzyme